VSGSIGRARVDLRLVQVLLDVGANLVEEVLSGLRERRSASVESELRKPDAHRPLLLKDLRMEPAIRHQGESLLSAKQHAALADARGVGVLHYDRDYDLIAKHTDLDFDSEWLAPAGSL
jgi:hypothetical protein